MIGEEKREERDIIREGGEVKRGVTICVLEVRVGVMMEKELDERETVIEASIEESGFADKVLMVDEDRGAFE